MRSWFVPIVLPPLCFRDWGKALLLFGDIDEGFLALLIAGRLGQEKTICGKENLVLISRAQENEERIRHFGQQPPLYKLRFARAIIIIIPQ